MLETFAQALTLLRNYANLLGEPVADDDAMQAAWGSVDVRLGSAENGAIDFDLAALVQGTLARLGAKNGSS